MTFVRLSDLSKEEWEQLISEIFNGYFGKRLPTWRPAFKNIANDYIQQKVRRDNSPIAVHTVMKKAFRIPFKKIPLQIRPLYFTSDPKEMITQAAFNFRLKVGR